MLYEKNALFIGFCCGGADVIIRVCFGKFSGAFIYCASETDTLGRCR